MSQAASTTVISAERHERLRQLFRDLWDYRELFLSFLQRDIKLHYKQTALGALWVVLQPLLLTGAYSIILGKFVGMPTDGLPYVLFYFAANVPWTAFSRAFSGAAMSIEGNVGLITKIYFPRVAVPAAVVCSSLVDFGVGWLFFNVMALVMGYWHWQLIAMTPLLMLIQGVAVLGIGLVLAALNAQYRDVKNAIGFITQLLMLATPVFYPESLLREKAPTLVKFLILNPMATVISAYRACLRGGPFDWTALGVGFLVSLAGLSFGLWFFRKREARFADIL